MTTPRADSPFRDVAPPESGEPRRELEPGILSMIAAVLVLLMAVGIVLWNASTVPNGRSVVVTIRNP